MLSVRSAWAPSAISGSLRIGIFFRPRSPVNTTRFVFRCLRRGLLDVDRGDRAAEDVACVEEGDADAGGDLRGAPVGHGDHALEHAEHVLDAVERLDGSSSCRPVARDRLVDEARVVRLDHGGVFEHDGAEVARRGRRVDRPVEPLLHEERERAGVIDVRVREDDGVERARRRRRAPGSGGSTPCAGPGTGRSRAARWRASSGSGASTR